ncbi:aldehyde dehydrogenase family protein [Phaeovulum sp.]|uniref:aldehyde dehydrogenase family protein n=1 Tax=Phaeovulum sp. TaxID=2934796 RepID=UPI003567845E
MQAVSSSDAAVIGREGYEAALTELAAARHAWAQSGAEARLEVLAELRAAVPPLAARWVEVASRIKQIPPGSALEGEEWLSGPLALLTSYDGYAETLRKLPGKRFLSGIRHRNLDNGQLALRVLPHNFWDRVLYSGISAEVWMQPGVTEANLASHAAASWDTPPEARQGALALVLGAGNITSIAPLDCLYKLLVEHQVVALKLNPVLSDLAPVLAEAMAPLIRRGVLRILQGEGSDGAWLATHPLVETIHITGAGGTHDAIVWGQGAEGAANKAAGRRQNPRPVTSELGAVCPTIVVPGPWSKADIAFQGEHIATQKLQNSGFNCVACQTLVLPEGWAGADPLLAATAEVMGRSGARPMWYPGAEARMQALAQSAGAAISRLPRGAAPALVLVDLDAAADACALQTTEAFAPVLAVKRLPGEDAERFLSAAIDWANDSLHGTLGANILIHPATLRAIGRARFEALLARLRYGCIAVNGWTGIGFLLAQTPWGAFPGHSPQDVQSGIGSVHNCLMLDTTERTVIVAPWAPFPRGLRHGFSVLPKPPWFITHRRAREVGRLLTDFVAYPAWRKLPRLMLATLRG